MSAGVPFVSLHRSEMFIANAINSISGAPAERNVSGMVRETDVHVSLRWSEKKSFGRAVYEHLAPNGAKATMFYCTARLNSIDVLTALYRLAARNLPLFRFAKALFCDQAARGRDEAEATNEGSGTE
jgi:hypothetical protein